MSNVIQLLPDSVANQIAAGEVVQRPASVVKELMENSIDAGATEIKVIVKEAGRSVIQVIDNGKGMSDTDARMAFERHATSKIRKAEDLFAISTMGFRGEALASIAAVAQVEMKTRTADEELGTQIEISGSKVIVQQPVTCPVGTQIVVKNLFFNIPARRRFLKKNSTELRHIINEFQRVALANPHIDFSLTHNDVPLFVLPKSNYRQRIIHLVGKQMNSHLIPVNTFTPLVSINGFIGKPEAARKTAGDQFFFVNNRYMRHPYFHKAVMTAYEKILQPGMYPAYFLYLEVDPDIIDVNIHPTKTEIKFEDERSIWHILTAAVRESLGKNNIVPSIDFDTDGSIDIPVSGKDEPVFEPEISVNPDYNPFETEEKNSSTKAAVTGNTFMPREKDVEGWEQLYAGFGDETYTDDDSSHEMPEGVPEQQKIEIHGSGNGSFTGRFLQVKNRYILTSVKSGLMMIDQKRAHERILYEQFIEQISSGKSTSQKALFPEEITYSSEDTAVMRELMDELGSFGFRIEEKEDGKFEIHALPGHLENVNGKVLIDGIISDFKTGEIDLKAKVREEIAGSMAKRSAIPYGKHLNQEEMTVLFDSLFACSEPTYSPSGKLIVSILGNDEIDKRFD
ncbi:MAG: DNA mismatch repair endonuclease MutL [Chlorobi bacterium]|nr:DNA mismatch repair endonuclease MutL [Chlorobiota bacterium]